MDYTVQIVACYVVFFFAVIAGGVIAIVNVKKCKKKQDEIDALTQKYKVNLEAWAKVMDRTRVTFQELSDNWKQWSEIFKK